MYLISIKDGEGLRITQNKYGRTIINVVNWNLRSINIGQKTEGGFIFKTPTCVKTNGVVGGRFPNCVSTMRTHSLAHLIP